MTVENKNWKWEGCKFEIQKTTATKIEEIQVQFLINEIGMASKLRKWNVMVCTQILWFILWYRETIRYERRHCIPHIIMSHFFPSQLFSQAFIIYKVPWVSLEGKVQHYEKRIMGCCPEKKYVLQAHLDPLYHELIVFFFCREKRYLKKLFDLKIIFVKEVNWTCAEVQLWGMLGRCVSLLPCGFFFPSFFQSSKKFKND